MQTWTGVTIAGAALLVLCGVPKLRHPAGTVMALRAVGLSGVGSATARFLTVVEMAIGATAVVSGAGWADGAVSATYVAFSAFLIVALRQSTATCGCTGRTDTPPTRGHLVMTATFALASGAAALTGGGTGILTMRHADPMGAITLLAFAAVLTWLSWALLNLVPRLEERRHAYV
jgi:hypothetical protein